MRKLNKRGSVDALFGGAIIFFIVVILFILLNQIVTVNFVPAYDRLSIIGVDNTATQQTLALWNVIFYMILFVCFLYIIRRSLTDRGSPQ